MTFIYASEIKREIVNFLKIAIVVIPIEQVAYILSIKYFDSLMYLWHAIILFFKWGFITQYINGRWDKETRNLGRGIFNTLR
jgi:hypothetical protein